MYEFSSTHIIQEEELFTLYAATVNRVNRHKNREYKKGEGDEQVKTILPEKPKE